jgi:hypothetical protein
MGSIKYNLDNNLESHLTEHYSIDLNRYTKKERNIFMSINDFLDTSIYDLHCNKMYGEKTCILFQIDDNKNKYEMRLIDKIKIHENGISYTKKDQFYKIIPELLHDKYTVVIIEKIDDINNEKKYDIIAVHVPLV